MTDHWSRHVGRGPAREACLAALFAFGVGRESAATPGLFDTLAPEERGFGWEGLGSAGAPPPAHAPPIAALFWRYGVGMALAARIPGGATATPRDPDEAGGYGFLLGLLRPPACLQRGFGLPEPLEAAALTGLGRALWFAYAGRPGLLVPAVRFAGSGRALPLWTGLGMAAVYTDGGPAEALQALLAAGDPLALAAGARLARDARLAHAGLGDHHAKAAAVLLQSTPTRS